MPPALTGNGNVLYFRCSDHARGKAPQKEARMETVRVAVIGVGNMGSAHAKTLHEGRIQGMHLVALCDHQPRRLEQLKAMYPDVACYAEYHEMLQKTTLDAVVIAVPHPIHAEIAMECMEHGLHVLTEKPMDIKVSQARKALEVAERTGKIYAIMFNQRTNPLFQRAREIVRSGELGELKRTVWMITNWYRTQHYYDSGSWRATWAGEGGGVLLNQAPHNLDLWQWICGMPVSVTAFCDVARYHHIEVEDDATLITRYANGATGLFVTSTGEYPGTNRLEISGDRGKIVLENGRLHWWQLQDAEHVVRVTSDVNSPKIPMTETEYVPDEKVEGHPWILQNFSDAILKGTPLLSPASDGPNELELSNAAYLSQWTGNCPVSLPLDQARFDHELERRQANSSYRETEETDTPDGNYSHRWQTNW